MAMGIFIIVALVKQHDSNLGGSLRAITWGVEIDQESVFHWMPPPVDGDTIILRLVHRDGAVRPRGRAVHSEFPSLI